MCKERDKFSIITWSKLAAFVLVIFCLPYITRSEGFLYHINPTSVRQSPYKPHYRNIEYFNGDYRYNQKYSESTRFQNEKVFQIEPSDAIDITKYSQPTLNHQRNSSPSPQVPPMSLSNDRIPPLPTQYHKASFHEQIPATDDVPKKNTSKPIRDSRFIESAADKIPHILKSSLGGEYKFGDENVNDLQSDMSYREDLLNSRSQDKNNFTNADANFLPVSSDAVLSYQTPSGDKETDIVKDNNSFKVSADEDRSVSSHIEKSFSTFSNSVVPSSISTLSELSTEAAIILNHFEILNLTDSVENAFSTAIVPSSHEEANFSSSIPLLDNGDDKLSSGTVAGIVIAVLVCVTLLSSAVIYLLYRKYNGKCTSVVEGKFNTDNCGYLDDSLRSSIYLNNHIELPKESSEEMSSLDNDSFLNSLETMTIQNYWADNSKNTKV